MHLWLGIAMRARIPLWPHTQRTQTVSQHRFLSKIPPLGCRLSTLWSAIDSAVQVP